MEDTRRDKQDVQRILLIKETILNAEKQIQTAKSLIAQLESNYTPQKKTYGVAEGGKIVEGSFDGQIMVGMDGRQYPVPANYASKSKLVEGDMLKLVITDDGNFVYKQIGPFKRKRLIGLLKQNQEEGGFEVIAEGKSYKVLLAAVTYHHASPGDEIALVVADTDEARWGAIENVLKKGNGEAVISEEPQKFELRGEEDEEAVSTPSGFLADEKKDDKTTIKPKKGRKEEIIEEKDEESETGLVESEDDSAVEKDIKSEITPDLAEMEKELKNQLE